MLGDSGAESGRHRRKYASMMPMAVAHAQQSGRKREIFARQSSPGVAVRHQPYSSVAVCRRFPVFPAARSPLPHVGGNALARGIRAANVRLRGGH